MNTLQWKEPDGIGKWDICKAHKATIGNVTYYARMHHDGSWHAFLRVHTPRRYWQRGFADFPTLEEAKQACERHFGEGCNVGRCPYRVRLSPEPLKRPRGSLLWGIHTGLISTDEAHKRGYMGKAELVKAQIFL
jgi:hypothetical protein